MFYVDLIKSGDFGDKHYEVFGKLVMILHNGPFQEHPHVYAIAFPEFNLASQTLNHDATVLRVFAPSLGQMNTLIRFLQKDARIGKLVKLESLLPEEVPDTASDYVTFKRFRLGNPTHKKSFDQRKAHAVNRLARLDLASRSTGQFFCLNVAMTPADPSGLWKPNSYGLSCSDQPTPIPFF